MSIISTVQQTHTRGNGSLEQRLAKLALRVARLEKALENSQAVSGVVTAAADASFSVPPVADLSAGESA